MIRCQVCHRDIPKDPETVSKHRKYCQGFASRCLEYCPNYRKQNDPAQDKR